MNYFEILSHNPVKDFKKYWVAKTVVNTSPAMDHHLREESASLIINKDSFWRPVVRLLSSKGCFYLSYKKNEPVEALQYGPSSLVLAIDKPIFGDIIIEVLHQREDKFIQLFMVQFHTFFVEEGRIRFTKEDIDYVCDDARYPEDFAIELVVDSQRDETLTAFDNEVSSWKNLMSDFFLKSMEEREEFTVNEPVQVEEEEEAEQVEEKSSELMAKMNLEEDEEEEEDMEDYLASLEERA